MKKIILLSLIMGFALSNIHAQMQMAASNGNISIAASPAPLAYVKVGINYLPTTLSSNSKDYAFTVGNSLHTTSGAYNFGIYSSAYSSSAASGRAYGVYGMAGNSTIGYNYGVYGSITGSQWGAAIYGSANGNGDAYIGGNYAGYFFGPVYSTDNMYATAFLPNSDKRLKKNITPLTNTVSNKISQLKAVTFKFKTRQELRADGTIPTDTSRSDTVNGKFVNYTHYGFIAQDVQNIFPNLVYQKDDGFLSVNYTELIPLIIDALKQQDSIITQQNATISNLQQQVNNCCTKGSLLKTDDQTGINDNNNGTATPALYQNNPNPFSKQTQIKCFIPDNAMVSVIYIYDMQGTQLRKIQINGKAEETIIIQGSELKAGMYMYSLIIDGKIIDTKKMILTD